MGLSLRGSTSGAIDINPPAIAGDNAITLPASNGSANQFFKNSGTAGIVTYSSMVENSGKIGIGTDNPIYKLDVLGTNVLANIKSTNNNYVLQFAGNNCPYDVYVGSDNANNFLLANENNDGTFTERLRIKSDGQISLRNDASEYGFLKENGLGNVELGGSTELYLSTNGSERLRISPAGAFGIAGANYGSSGQVLTSQGSSSAPTWSTVTSSLSFYFYGRQDSTHSIADSTYTRIKNLGTNAINQGDSSIATWNESVGTLTIGASGAGYWFLAGGSGIDDVSTGDYIQTVIGKNGGTTSLNAAISTYARSMSSASNFILESNVTTIAYLEPNDVVACYIYQAGTAAAQPTEANRCFFMGYKMMT